MAYVQPISRVILLRETGLSPDYQHTYRFRTAAEQSNFFMGKKAYEFDSLTFQRVSANQISVERLSINLYSCDYLMFQNNRGTGGLAAKWYYAFITNVEYVNEHTSLITYQIDELQTWFVRLFDGMQPCMILREHSSDDALYANTQPENLDLGNEYQYESQKWHNLAVQPSFHAPNDVEPDGFFGGWLPVIVIPYEGDTISINVVTYIPYPVSIISFKSWVGNFGFFTYMQKLQNERQTEIVDMFMYPEALLKPSAPGVDPNVINETVRKAGKPGGNPWKDYFTPKNNKLYTYPYCFILVTNNCGKSLEFKNEYFARNLDDAIFDISGTFGIDPEFSCIPREYNETQAHAGMNALTLSGVPKIPWVTDSYKVYMSQNASSIRTNNVLTAMNAVRGIGSLIGGIGTTVASLATGTGSGSGINDSAAYSGISAMLMNNAKMQDARKMSDSTHTASSPNAMYIEGLFGFKAYMARIPVEYAKRIDDYFTMFGYATNRIGKPDIFSRKSFNFLQASNVCVTTRVPIPAKITFVQCLANGITFWNPSVKIGNYDADNTL